MISSTRKQLSLWLAVFVIALGMVFPAKTIAQAETVYGSLSGNEAAMVLEGTKNTDRLSALKALEPQIRGNLGGDEFSAIVGDESNSYYRSRLIAVLAKHARTGLEANEVAMILGNTENTSRLGAVKALEPAVKYGLDGEEFSKILGSTKGHYRGRIIGVLAEHSSAVTAESINRSSVNTNPIKETIEADKCGVPFRHFKFYIDDPSCDHKWNYYQRLKLTTPWMNAYGDALTAKEEMADTVQTAIKTVSSISGALKGMFGSSEIAVKAINASHLQLIIVDLLPIENKSAEMGKTIINLVADALVGVVENAQATNVSEPYSAVISLGTDIGTLWTYDQIIEERQGLIIAEKYLDEYYKFGSSQELLAEKYSLAKDASQEEIIDAVAGHMGYHRKLLGKDYRIDHVRDLINAFDIFVKSMPHEIGI